MPVIVCWLCLGAVGNNNMMTAQSEGACCQWLFVFRLFFFKLHESAPTRQHIILWLHRDQLGWTASGFTQMHKQNKLNLQKNELSCSCSWAWDFPSQSCTICRSRFATWVQDVWCRMSICVQTITIALQKNPKNFFCKECSFHFCWNCFTETLGKQLQLTIISIIK